MENDTQQDPEEDDTEAHLVDPERDSQKQSKGQRYNTVAALQKLTFLYIFSNFTYKPSAHFNNRLHTGHTRLVPVKPHTRYGHCATPRG